MKHKLYPFLGVMMLFVLQFGILNLIYSQDCSKLIATYQTTESRCTATGTLQVNVSGGSGTYNYKVQGGSSTVVTSSSLIAGLSPGNYTVTITDIVSNCSFQISNVSIAGTYADPRFGLTQTDVTCVNGTDGTISATGLQFGLAPFSYTLVAPSPMGVGTSNATGLFTGLIPGQYAVELMDSCGGIQTRNISIQNYNWSITSATVALVGCTNRQGLILLVDSKGNNNTVGAAFTGFTYGFVNGAGDTTWFATNLFSFDLLQDRSIVLVAKDRCGLVQQRNWTNTSVPNIGANVSISGTVCSGFTATVIGQQNLTTPTYCLFDNLGNPVPGQLCNASGIFTNIPYGSYCIKMTNSCYDTVISRCFNQAKSVPTISGAVALSNYNCTTFSATVTGQANLTNPQYCLFDNLNNPVGLCNTTGIFSNITYGTYTIKVTDGCTGTVLSIPFTGLKWIRSVANSITVTGTTCTSFTATITGQSNLTSPQYCLVDNLGNPIVGIPCNATGIFSNLPYGTYCIHITDACGDTAIQRCVTVTRPVAVMGAPIISNKTCSGFTVTASGQANIFNGLYCLQDGAGNPVAAVPCNTTGVFTNLPYGSYCLKVTDGCSGLILTNCFSVTPPIPSVGPVSISNETCAGFTATQTGQQNLTTPTYCLYNSLNILVGTCNVTGVFNNITYGSYTIKTTDGCAGAIFLSPFSVVKPVPAIGATVNYSNQTCTTFSATIFGQSNLTAPKYYLKNNAGISIDSNMVGMFNNLTYGSYCINVVNSCLDTTISRCFTVAASPTTMTVSAAPGCSFGAADITVQVLTGIAPYTVNVYDSINNLVRTIVSNSTTLVLSNLRTILSGEQYKVVLTSSCGTPATQMVSATPSSLHHLYTITPKCPSSSGQNGSADLLVVATSNLSSVNLSITQKNYVPDVIGYAFNIGSSFTFSNLDPAQYVITYSFAGCSTTINDTITVPPYQFPNLSKSAAYQCDNNSFSIGASVTGGVSPFTYAVIGSSPAAPSIIAGPQASPVFGINNGSAYSVVRLRAIDGCGNATLNDVSILPLANTIVTSSSDCIFTTVNLTTDSIPNATYIWYKKTDATDSMIVGTNASYNIPFLTLVDTGMYISRVSINSGCLTKLSYFYLDGMCGGLKVLPVSVMLTGKPVDNHAIQLNWTAYREEIVQTYGVERSQTSDGIFEPIGTVTSNESNISTAYQFIDKNPLQGTNFYRLRIVETAKNYAFSNTVVIRTISVNSIAIYPNPVLDVININISGSQYQTFRYLIYNTAGQTIFASVPVSMQNGSLKYFRDQGLKGGSYFLQVINLTTGQTSAFKLVLQ